MNLKHAAAALALTSLVAAGAAQAAPKEITVAIASTFTTLDPYDASDTLSQTASKSFYEGLFTFDKDMKVIDALATDYKVSDDGLVYTVTLRKGVKFHDGSEFQADAVKANFDRVTNKANGLKRYMLYQNIEKTEVVDPYTVRFTLKKPFSSFINQLAHPAGVMICPSTLANKTNKQIAFEPCGTGPYTLDKYNPSEGMRVVKNPNYWQAGFPKLDAINWKPVVENSTRVAMLLTGEAQFAFPLPAEQVKQVQGKDQVRLDITPSIILRYVEMNMSKKPFQDKRVREALNYAINKEALCKVAFAGYAFRPRALQGSHQSQIQDQYDRFRSDQQYTRHGLPNARHFVHRVFQK